MIRHYALLRERPSLFIVIGLFFMGIGLIIGCLSVTVFELGSHARLWAGVAICFVIGGTFVVMGQKQRRLNMLRQAREGTVGTGTISTTPAGGTVVAFGRVGFATTGYCNQNIGNEQNRNPGTYPVQPYSTALPGYPPPYTGSGPFAGYNMTAAPPYESHVHPMGIGNPTTGNMPPPPSYDDATKQGTVS